MGHCDVEGGREGGRDGGQEGEGGREGEERGKGGKSPLASLTRSSWSVGDVVLARFEGEEEFFEGKVGADNGDGTYRVDFDDGDVDERVLAEHILPRAVLSSLPVSA